MTADPMRAKALAVLREGRCSIVRITADSEGRPRQVEAHVTSSRPERTAPYVVDFASPDWWTCTCRDGMATPPQPCPHVAAVQLVTTGAAA